MTAAIGTWCGSRERSRLDPALSDRGFDRGQKARAAAANDEAADAADASADGGDDAPDMFSAAGVAAE